jgi:hypothetical protein
LAKRRARGKPSKAQKQAARFVRKAFQKVGKKKRESAALLRKNLTAEMARVARETFISTDPRTGRARKLSKKESGAIARRLSLAGLASRVAREETRRDFTLDKRGRWHRADGRLISQANMRRSMSVRAYWNKVRIVAKAQEVSVAEARRALKIGGAELWEKVVGETP